MSEAAGKKVGFVGLGVMGLPMALNARRKGFDVAGWARGRATAERAAGAGIEMRASPAELAADRDFLVTMVTTSGDVLEVALGDRGLVEAARPGTMLIDMSTIAPVATHQVAEACAGRGLDFIDAPVSGGSTGAERGTLTIMVGGEAAVLERARPLLESMGDPERIFHVGPVGSGEIVKIVNNMLVGAISAATMEALLVGVRAGVPLRALVDVVSASSGGSTQLTGQLVPRALSGKFEPGFATDLLVKDLGLAAALAGESAQEVPFAELARDLFRRSQAAGHGAEDYTALLLELENEAGTRLRLE
jgi:3-hydroxyisobutyrate dehydrogenase-like beta-hydroxyacid dehydrogenase